MSSGFLSSQRMVLGGHHSSAPNRLVLAAGKGKPFSARIVCISLLNGVVKGSISMSRVTELLGSSYPIIQGAMGVISNPEFVAAVSEAGGYGLLATAFATDPEFVRSQVLAAKEHTKRPFGANLHAMNPLVTEFAQVLADEGIRAVTVSGGSPKAIVPFLKERGVKSIAVVPTVQVAQRAEALGVDAIVAEGTESGGMQGFRGASTMVLVPLVVDAVSVPVIAAGGIGDSRGFKAARALGAEGVQVGTRFIASRECVAHQNYKDFIVDCPETGTGLVDLGRFRLRALRTSRVEKYLDGEPANMSDLAGNALDAAWLKGNLEAGILPAGEVAGLVRSVPSVREIIEEMVS
jgi:enoyl-[acyl-carrier protein] reductase II